MYKKLFKRLFDLALSILALPLLLSIILIFGFIIYLEDKGKIFHISKRLGKKGKIFNMFKLRTMKENSVDIRNKDGSTFNAENDSRLTKIGRILRRLSIDEVPQILNVIKGEMSLIGPRPDLPDHINLYSEKEKLKLNIRPGITGLSQAYFRNEIPWKERIKIDIEYVNKISFTLDLKIFFKTIFVILKSEKIFIKK